MNAGTGLILCVTFEGVCLSDGLFLLSSRMDMVSGHAAESGRRCMKTEEAAGNICTECLYVNTAFGK